MTEQLWGFGIMCSHQACSPCLALSWEFITPEFNRGSVSGSGSSSDLSLPNLPASPISPLWMPLRCWRSTRRAVAPQKLLTYSVDIDQLGQNAQLSCPHPPFVTDCRHTSSPLQSTPVQSSPHPKRIMGVLNDDPALLISPPSAEHVQKTTEEDDDRNGRKSNWAFRSGACLDRRGPARRNPRRGAGMAAGEHACISTDELRPRQTYANANARARLAGTARPER